MMDFHTTNTFIHTKRGQHAGQRRDLRGGHIPLYIRVERAQGNAEDNQYGGSSIENEMSTNTSRGNGRGRGRGKGRKTQQKRGNEASSGVLDDSDNESVVSTSSRKENCRGRGIWKKRGRAVVRGGGMNDRNRGIEKQKKEQNDETEKMPLPNKSIEERIVFHALLSGTRGGQTTLEGFTNLLADVLSQNRDVSVASDWLRKHPDSFRFASYNPENPGQGIVSVFNKKLRLCHYYQDVDQGCRNPDCSFLHICPCYISGYCPFGSECQLVHGFDDSHNRTVINNLGLNDLSTKLLQHLVFCSIPLVCAQHNTSSGCPLGSTCTMLHVCDQYLKDICSKGTDCQFCHQFDSQHTLFLLESFKMKGLKEVVLKKNIVVQILPEKSIVGNIYGAPADESDSDSMASTTSKKEGNKDQGGRRKRRGKGRRQKFSTSVERGSRVGRKRVADEGPQEKFASINHKDVFYTLLTGCGKGQECLKDFLRILSDLSGIDFDLKASQSWIKEHSNNFRMATKNVDDHGQDIVSVFHKRLKICFNYRQTGRGCTNENCEYLHVCAGYICGTCYFGSACKLQHSLDDDHNQQLLTRLMLNVFSNEEIHSLLLCSIPFVCREYNTKDGCMKKQACSMFHVCQHHMKNKCPLPESKCPFDHNLDSEHSKFLLDSFGLTGLNTSTQLRSLRIGSMPSGKYQENKRLDSETGIVPTMDDDIEASLSARAGKAKPLSKPHRNTERGNLNKERRQGNVETKIEVDAIYVLKIVLKEPYQGRCSYLALGRILSQLSTYEQLSSQSIKSWIHANGKYFRYLQDDSSCSYNTTVIVKVNGLKICLDYCSKNGCNKVDTPCEYFHICRDFLGGLCSRQMCRFNHDILDLHNSQIAQQRNLDKLKDVLFEAILSSTPKVCNEYNSDSCSNEKCTDIHICKGYLNKSCQIPKPCALNHNLSGIHNQNIMKLFQIDKLSESMQRKRIILNHRSSGLEQQGFLAAKPPCDHESAKYLAGIVSLLNTRPSDSFDVKQTAANMKSNQTCVKFDRIDKGEAVNIPDAKEENTKVKSNKTSENSSLYNAKIRPKIIINSKESDLELENKKTSENSVASNRLIFGAIEGATKLKSNEASLDCFASQVETKTPILYAKEVKDENMLNHVEEHFREDLIGRSNIFICEEFIRTGGVCSLYPWCDSHHYHLPYAWMKKDPGASQWCHLSEYLESKLEAIYCNPGMKKIILNGTEYDLKNMKANSSSKLCRLSTSSYCSKRFIKSESSFATVWQWYWEDNGKIWKAYGLDGAAPFQDVLEAKYLENKESCLFDMERFPYKINLNSLQQKNLQTDKVRQIHRRPVYVNPEDVKNHVFPKVPIRRFNPSKLPAEWDPTDTESANACELVDLDKGNIAFRHVKHKFEKSLDNVEIVNIFRIQNLRHWETYKREKEIITSKVGSDTELQLFHGSDSFEVIKSICYQNFDHRMAGKNATIYGMGAYFATTAKYSDSYAKEQENGSFYMFLALVTVGRFAQGNSSLKRPPPLHPDKKHNYELYDSCVDNINKPSIYVIFDSKQCYPAFLIEYKKKADSRITSSGNSFLSSSRSSGGSSVLPSHSSYSSLNRSRMPIRASTTGPSSNITSSQSNNSGSSGQKDGCIIL